MGGYRSMNPEVRATKIKGSGLRYFGIGRQTTSFCRQASIDQFRKNVAPTPVLQSKSCFSRAFVLSVFRDPPFRIGNRRRPLANSPRKSDKKEFCHRDHREHREKRKPLPESQPNIDRIPLRPFSETSVTSVAKSPFRN